MSKPMVLVGPQVGEIVKDGKVIRTDHIVWCLRCLTKKIKNHQALTKADKKFVDSCEMRDYVVTDRDGVEIRGKTCKRCKQTIVLSEDNIWQEPKKA